MCGAPIYCVVLLAVAYQRTIIIVLLWHTASTEAADHFPHGKMLRARTRRICRWRISAVNRDGARGPLQEARGERVAASIVTYYVGLKDDLI